MTGALQPPVVVDRAPPLLTPSQASALLDHVIYDRIAESIDLEAIRGLADTLTLMIADLTGAPLDQVRDIARELVDRAMLRLPSSIMDFLDIAGAEGHGFPDCILCEAEARASPAASPARRKRNPAE